MDLKCSLMVTAPSSNVEPYRYIELRIEDQESRTLIFQAQMSMEQWGKLVTAHSQVDDVPAVLTPDLVGMKLEVKTEKVPLPVVDSYERDVRRAAYKEAIRPFEVDGWVGRVDDTLNHHKISKGVASVAFRRYVKREA